MADDIDIKFGADIGDLQRKIAEATSSIDTFFQRLSGAASGTDLSEAFGGIFDGLRDGLAELEGVETETAAKISQVAIESTQRRIDTQLDIQRGALEQQRALGQIGAVQAAETERALEEARIEAVRAGIQARIVLAGADIDARAKLLAELERAEQAHQARLTAIDTEAAKERAAVEQIKVRAKEQADVQMLSAEKARIDQARDMGQISAEQALDQYRQLENNRYQLALEGNDRRAQLGQGDAALAARIAAEREQIERTHQDMLTAIDTAAAQERAQVEQVKVRAKEEADAQMIAGERARVAQALALGQISNQQAIEQYRQLEVRRYALAQEAMVRRMQLAQGDNVQSAKLLAEREAMERTHQQRLQAIAHAGALDRVKSEEGASGNILQLLTSHVGKVKAIMATLAGGFGLKSAVDETVELTDAARDMGNVLGITATEASTLNTALGDVFSSSDAYTSSFIKFNRAIRSNSEELQQYGIDIEAVRNGQKSSNEAFVDALGVFQEMKPGIDQTQFAMVAFGRSVTEVHRLQRLLGDSSRSTVTTINEQGQEVTRTLTAYERYQRTLAEAKKKNEELNLTVTQEGLAGVKAYKDALNDAGDVISGVSKTIGDAFIPILTRLFNAFSALGPGIVAGVGASAEFLVGVTSDVIDVVSALWDVCVQVFNGIGAIIKAVFGESAPSAFQFFADTLNFVRGVVILLRTGVETMANIVGTGIDVLSAAFVGFVNVAGAALRLDFKGATAAYKASIDEQMRVLEAGMRRAVEIGERGAKDFDAAWNPEGGAKKTEATEPEGKGTGTATAKDDGSGTARLQIIRAREEAALALQREFLRQAEAIYTNAYRQGEISIKEFYDAKLAIETKAIDLSIAAKRREAAALASQASAPGQKESQRLQLQAQEQKTLGEINVLEAQRNNLVRQNTVEYLNAERERNDRLAEISISATQSRGNAQLDIERSMLDRQRTLGEVNATQAEEIDQQLETRRVQIQRTAIQQRIELARNDTVKRAELTTQLEQVEAQHQARLTSMETQGIQQRAQIAGIRLQAMEQANTTMLANEAAAVQQLRALGQINAEQELTALRSLEERRFSLQQQTQERRIAMAQGDAVKTAQLLAEREQQERDHQAALTEIDAAGVRERAKYQMEANRGIRDNFTGLLNDLMDGTKKLSTAWDDFVVGVARSIQRLIAQKFSDRLFDSLGGNKVVDMLIKPFEFAVDTIVGLFFKQQTVMTAAQATGTTERVAIEESGQEAGLLMLAAGAVKRIAIAAWEAAAAVYASIAAIPYVGPFLAPAMAIAAGATVLGFAKNIASAEGGWYQVPGDQVAQIHRDEMVIPATESGGLRQVITDAQDVAAMRAARSTHAQQGGGGVTIHAVDALSFVEFASRNRDAFATAVEGVARDRGMR